MKILDIPYSIYEVYDLIYFVILFVTLPIGLITQIYLSIKDYNEAVPIVPVKNTKPNKKNKKR